MPPPAGDGKSEETGFVFRQGRNKFEAVGMARAYLRTLGVGSCSWTMVTITGTELTEYAATPKGKIWFRCRLDPRLPQQEGADR
jgi:hypothetical protein